MKAAALSRPPCVRIAATFPSATSDEADTVRRDEEALAVGREGERPHVGCLRLERERDAPERLPRGRVDEQEEPAPGSDREAGPVGRELDRLGAVSPRLAGLRVDRVDRLRRGDVEHEDDGVGPERERLAVGRDGDRRDVLSREAREHMPARAARHVPLAEDGLVTTRRLRPRSTPRRSCRRRPRARSPCLRP